ncbi:MAG: response regulator [Kofleriaceae bacterium]
MSKLSVLVVDDEPDILSYVDDLLTGAGHRVTTVQSPNEALTKIRGEVFHIVLLDLTMPEMSGMDLLAKIREVDDDLPVIILTANPSYKTARCAIAHDVSAYIEKPNFHQEYQAQFARIIKRKGIVLRSDAAVLARLGQRIRALRVEHQLTLRQLSRRANLSVSMLSQIERSTSAAAVPSLVKIAAALDVSIAELFAEDASSVGRRRPTSPGPDAPPPPT